MRHLICTIMLLAAVPAGAAELTDIAVRDIKALAAAEAPAPGAPEPARGYQGVFMQVRNQPEWGAVEANDYTLRVDLSVRRVFDGQYDMFNRVDGVTQMGSIRKVFNSDWQLSGYGSYLDLREFAGSYTLSGSVPGEGSQARYLDLNVSRRYDGFSWYVSGFGLNLNLDRYGLNGGYDPDRYSKQALTAVISMIFALQGEAALPAGR